MNNKRYFIYTGNAYPHKNLDKLINAILLTSFRLKIVSARNVFTQRLMAKVLEKKAREQVEILGFVDDEKLKKLYKKSIAIVFPTLDEGFGLPPMEAINAGTLAVVSDIPVLKEVYKNSVFYFDPNDINSIKKNLEKVADISDVGRKKYIQKSQRFLKKYSWLKMAKETLKIYNQNYR